jgi:hypothetical protein
MVLSLIITPAVHFFVTGRSSRNAEQEQLAESNV